MNHPESYFAAAVAVLLMLLFFYLVGRGLMSVCGA